MSLLFTKTFFCFQVVEKSPSCLGYHAIEHGDVDSDVSSPRILHPVTENLNEDVCSGEEHSIGSSSGIS